LPDAASIRKIAGMDVHALDAAFDYTAATSRFGGLLVAGHGHLVYERYFGRASREVTPNMASCGKMFTSVCLGIVLHQNPAAFPQGLSQNVFTSNYLVEAFSLSDPRKADIRLGHLLSMTSGMADGPGNPGIVHGEDTKIENLPANDPTLGQDASALRTPMWTTPGGGIVTHLKAFMLPPFFSVVRSAWRWKTSFAARKSMQVGCRDDFANIEHYGIFVARVAGVDGSCGWVVCGKQRPH
jgi:hypothetical protein